MKIRINLAVLVLLVSIPAFAGNVTVVDRFARDFPVDALGSLWIDNPFGSIEVVGTDQSSVINTAVQRTVTGVDQAALREGREAVQMAFEGDNNVRLIRTVIPQMHSSRWSVSVTYVIRVPHSLHIKIATKNADHVRVTNIMGNVTVNAFSGTIILDSVTGASSVSTVNGKVIYNFATRPMSHAQIQAINADIEVYAPPDSFFEWISDSIKGDVMTTFPVRGKFVSQTMYRGTVNAQGGPTLTTATLLGHVAMMAKGIKPSLARSLRAGSAAASAPDRAPLGPSEKIQLPFVHGDWVFAASVADISVGEIQGNAHVETGAGEVEIGVVFGTCFVKSLGGPLSLGDMLGPLTAHTGAGDVVVKSARRGGEISTGGGLIRLLSSNGPTTLRSGGGDIVVRQASAAIDAETTSGDITITVDPSDRTEKISAHTVQGNITLVLKPQFAADIDATVVVREDNSNSLQSDFAGLSVRREQINGKTHIHATGKINGGGERVELYADDGSIHITSQMMAPIRVATPH